MEIAPVPVSVLHFGVRFRFRPCVGRRAGHGILPLAARPLATASYEGVQIRGGADLGQLLGPLAEPLVREMLLRQFYPTRWLTALRGRFQQRDAKVAGG